MPKLESPSLRSDASELVLSNDSDYVAETYLFEPAPSELKLGRLIVAGETESRDGIGKELLDLTIQALQKEYYRDPSRTVLTGFESALHQANLVLHDAAEQGLRDWMGYFHVAVGVFANGSLHISTAGHGTIFLIRKSSVSELSADLSYSPVTEPLRTFSQVASGALIHSDTLLFGSSALQTAYTPADLARISIDHGAERISARLASLYEDKQLNLSLAAVIVTISNPIAVTTHIPSTTVGEEVPRRQSVMAKVNPRTPLIIQRTALRAFLAIFSRLLIAVWIWLQAVLWPLFVRSSQAGGRVVARASITTGKRVSELTQQGVKKVRQRGDAVPFSVNNQPSRSRWHTITQVKNFVVSVPSALLFWLTHLPRTSKIFASIAILLTIVLIASLSLLQSKRADDAAIQRASEILHDAQTKTDAAQTALIFDNRDQARNLLTQAQQQARELAQTNLYVEEVNNLNAQITTMQDRLQRVTRASTATTSVVGDFDAVIDNSIPISLSIIGDTLYSFNPTTNAIIAMGQDGVSRVVTATTSGIGFLGKSTTHPADKTIVFTTDTPGMALFDSKSEELANQNINYTSDQPEIMDIGTYGSRLYVLDRAAKNIFSYSKSLSGYGSGSAWITDADFATDSIVSFSVDGSIFTLHDDGSVQQLYRGEHEPDFTLEPTDPPLAGATRLLTSDSLTFIYIFDPRRGRVVIYNKQGELQQQVVLDIATDLNDITISEDETTLYALDGSRVLSVSLAKQ